MPRVRSSPYLSPSEDVLLATRIKLATGAALTAANLHPPAGVTPGDFVAKITSRPYPAQQRALTLGIIATETDQAARAPLITALSK